MRWWRVTAVLLAQGAPPGGPGVARADDGPGPTVESIVLVYPVDHVRLDGMTLGRSLLWEDG